MTHAAHGAGASVAWDALSPEAAPAVGPLDGPTSADVVVVGLGASGLTACRRLAERGADVVGVDAMGIAAGAAGRNGGFLLVGAAHFHHRAVAAWGHEVALGLYRESCAELERTLDDLQAHAPEAIVSRDGSLRIASGAEEAADLDEQLRAMRQDGLAVEPYTGPEGVGLLVPEDAGCNPVARAHHLASRAVEAGARLHAPARVASIGAGTVTLADGAVVTASRVVVAVDGGLEWVLPELAGRVRTTRLQMLATAPDPTVRFPRPVYRRWGYEYVQQAPGGEILLGGCRDRFEDDEWEAPAEPSHAVQSCLEEELRVMGVRAPVTHRWAAHAGFTPDRLPICEEVRDGVLAIGGYSGHGNLLGTLAARRAADAALDGGELRLLDG